MRQKFYFVLLAALTVLLAAPSFAQTVAYSGKLQIGFGDQDNTLPTLVQTNNAIPICAGQPPSNLPATNPAGTTLGTLIVNGRGDGGAGVGAPLTFSAVSATTGGAQEFDNDVCNVVNVGFANPRLRSRTQIGAAHWPGRKGPFTTNITTAPIPSVPPTYMLSAGNGNAADFTTTVPFLGAGDAQERVQRGGIGYGGGVPFSGGGGVQLGVNFVTTTPNGATLAPGDYGLVLYANGFLPTDPQVFGTDFKGVGLRNVITASAPTTYPNGVILGTQGLSYAARTPGGTTVLDQGAIRTAFGGNTRTPVAPPTIIPIVSPVAFSGAFFEWTTGTVTHTDMVGDFTTIRTAMGSDVAVSGPGGATRRLQVVSPWAASIKVVGSAFGLAALLPQLGFGGVAELELNIIPIPEPGTLLMLGFGVVGLAGLGAARRRNS
jgi:hypothetical protein